MNPAIVDHDGERFVIDISWDGSEAVRDWLERKPTVETTKLGHAYPIAWKLARLVPREYWSQAAMDAVYDLTLEFSQLLEAQQQTGGDPRLTVAQQQGVNWLMRCKRGILADGMGSGKTVQVCSALERMHDDGPLNVLIVCPLSVVPVWDEHLREWTTLPEPVVAHGRLKDAMAAEAITHGSPLIVPWSSLASLTRLTYFHGAPRDEDRAPKILDPQAWDVVVGDEAHRAKDPKARQTRAFRGLVGAGTHCVWLLTGTPLANNPTDYWSLLRLVDPDGWPSRQRFVDDWCKTKVNPHGSTVVQGFKDGAGEVLGQLTADRVLRRSMQDVTGMVIEKVRKEIWVEQTARQRDAAARLAEEWRAELAEGKELTVANALALTSALYEIAQADPHLDEDGRIEMRAPSPKIRALYEFVKDLDEPVVVFSKSRKLARLIYAEMSHKRQWKLGYVDGDTHREGRKHAVERFAAGGRRMLIATTKTLGEGVNLSASRIVVNLSGTWSLIDSKQSEDRVSRPGQASDEVLIVDIMARDTIDERVRNVVRGKRQLAASVDWRRIAREELGL